MEEVAEITAAVKNAPALRFPEFGGEWDEAILDKLVEFKSGGTPSMKHPEYWDGQIPWISASSMVGKYYSQSDRTISKLGLANGSRLAPKGSLLLLVRGSMLFNKIPIGIAGVDVSFNQDVKALVTKEDSDTEFIYQWFSAKQNQLLNKVTGTGIGAGKLDTEELKNMKVGLPSLPEQQKIASFFTVVDDKIQQLKRKKALLKKYKKGVMQQIFSQQSRFKDDNGNDFPEWEEKRLGECLDYTQPTKYLVASTDYSNNYKTPVLTAGKTFILGYTDETEGVFEEGLPVIIFDDFTTATQFVGFPFKAKSSAMKILVAKEQFNIKFLYEVMQQLKYEVGGHERHWISKFAYLNILVPSTNEQNKIANFLTSIDDKINYASKQLEQAKQFKKGLLQQLFV